MGKTKARAKRDRPVAADQAAVVDDGVLDLYRPVLKQYCAPAIVSEFEAMKQPGQLAMLEAFREAIWQLDDSKLRAALSSFLDENQRWRSKKPLGKHQCQDLVLCFRAYLESQPGAESHSSTHSALKAALEQQYDDKLTVSEDRTAFIADALTQWGAKEPGTLDCAALRKTLAEKAELKRKGMDIHLLPPLPAPAHFPAAPSAITWDSLRPVAVRDLPLFQSVPGAVFVGTIISRPTHQVVIHMTVEDSLGNLVSLSMRSQLKGQQKEQDPAALQEKFPPFSRVLVAEPFYRIDANGCRTISVTSAKTFRVGADADGALRGLPGAALPRVAPLEAPLLQAATDAKKLIKAKQPEQALAKCLALLRGAAATELSDHTVLLANRAQAALRHGCPAAALRDAAATLLLCPSHEKGWFRYKTALRALASENLQVESLEARAAYLASVNVPVKVLTEPDAGPPPPRSSAVPLRIKDVDAVLSSALEKDPYNFTSPQDCIQHAHVLRENGNQAFRSGAYLKAIKAYTGALARHESTQALASLLCTLADASLSVNSLHTALAAAAACRAITDNAERHLQQHVTSVILLAYSLAFLKRAPLAQEVLRICVAKLNEEQARRFGQKLLKARNEIEAVLLPAPGSDLVLREAFDLQVDYLGSVSFVDTAEERCFRAASDLPPASVVMVSRPLLYAAPEGDAKASLTFFGKSTECLKCHAALRDGFTGLAAEDALCARTLDALDGTIHADPRRVGRATGGALLSELQNAASPLVLPMLPQWRAFVPADEHPELLRPALDRLCAVNSVLFSRAQDAEEPDESNPTGGFYPLGLLMSDLRGTLAAPRDAQPNCVWSYGAPTDVHRQSSARAVVVMTVKPVKAGEKLVLDHNVG